MMLVAIPEVTKRCGGPGVEVGQPDQPERVAAVLEAYRFVLETP